MPTLRLVTTFEDIYTVNTHVCLVVNA